MKILTTIVSQSNNTRIEPCLNTWVKDIKQPHDYLIAGDNGLVNKYHKAINCSSEQGEGRIYLSHKTINIIKHIINMDFDFWHKCDDDVFVDYNAFANFISNYDPSQELYIGMTIVNPIEYALGFSYVISKPLLIKIYDKLLSNIDLYTSDVSEDRMIGRCMMDLNIKCNAINEFYCPLRNTPPEQQSQEIAAKLMNKTCVLGTMHKDAELYMHGLYEGIKKYE